MKDCTNASHAATTFIRDETTPGESPHRTWAGFESHSKAFRQLGLWAIDSVNANAWPGLYEYITTTAADIVMGQEVKRLPGDQTAAAEAALRNLKWRGKINPCERGPKGGPSAGTLVAVRSHIGMSQPDGYVIEDSHARVQLQKVGAVCTRGLHAGTMYLIDGIGPTHPRNVDVLDEMAKRLSLISGPWVLCGDFNCEPAELAATGFLDLINGNIHAPTDMTCGNRKPDSS